MSFEFDRVLKIGHCDPVYLCQSNENSRHIWKRILNRLIYFFNWFSTVLICHFCYCHWIQGLNQGLVKQHFQKRDQVQHSDLLPFLLHFYSVLFSLISFSLFVESVRCYWFVSPLLNEVQRKLFGHEYEIIPACSSNDRLPILRYLLHHFLCFTLCWEAWQSCLFTSLTVSWNRSGECAARSICLKLSAVLVASMLVPSVVLGHVDISLGNASQEHAHVRQFRWVILTIFIDFTLVFRQI